MITINETEYEFIPKTRAMAQFERRFQVKDILIFFKEARNKPDPEVMAVAMLDFVEPRIKDINEAYDLIDGFLCSGNTLTGLYDELIGAINEHGFFKSRLTPDQLEQELKGPVLDMAVIVDKAITEVSREFAKELGLGS